MQALIQEEIRLAKTEMSEKGSCYVRNAVAIAIGGFVACAGLIVFLLGLGSLIGHLLENAGLDPLMAAAIGWGGIGFLIALVGGIMVMKAIKTFSQSTLAPEKTIETIHELKGDRAEYAAAEARQKVDLPRDEKRTSSEIKASVETTQKMMGETIEELGHRITPRYMGKSLVAGVKHHPARTAIIGLATGLLGFLAVRWRIDRQHAAELARHAHRHALWRWRHAHR
ncbi:MAG: phage holin family protein [Verrucomicrobia subdivision 3 bacterium]|nr:phage holin family protein [Limisphaerales bacterium]